MTGPEVAPADPADRVEFTARRVGPGQPQAAPGERISALAADNHFASALITLWHRVSQAGGAAGFDPAAPRSEIAPGATEAVAGLRAGSWKAVVLTEGNTLVGAAFLVRRPLRIQRHVAEIRGLLVNPDHRGSGLAVRLLDEIVLLASELGVTVLTMAVREGQQHDASPLELGFVEFGRLSGADLTPLTGSDSVPEDEIHYRRTLS